MLTRSEALCFFFQTSIDHEYKTEKLLICVYFFRNKRKDHKQFTLLGVRNEIISMRSSCMQQILNQKTHLSNFLFLISLDFLRISNENNDNLGLLCGQESGEEVLATGMYVMMTFHSDPEVTRRGFLLEFTAVPHGKRPCRAINMIG